jgi:hypothetical protein
MAWTRRTVESEKPFCWQILDLTRCGSSEEVAMNDQGSGTPAVENRVVMIDRSEKRRRIWVQHVDVDTARIESRVRAIRKREPLTPYQDSVADAVCDFSQRARLAANKTDPAPRAVANWWRGTLVEAAYRNLHAARTQLID